MCKNGLNSLLEECTRPQQTCINEKKSNKKKKSVTINYIFHKSPPRLQAIKIAYWIYFRHYQQLNHFNQPLFSLFHILTTTQSGTNCCSLIIFVNENRDFDWLLFIFYKKNNQNTKKKSVIWFILQIKMTNQK